MEICPVSVAKKLLQIVEKQYPQALQVTPSEKDELIAKELVQSLQNIIMECIFEDDEVLDEVPNSEVSAYSQQLLVDDTGKEVLSDGVSLERKQEILKLVRDHPKWKVSTIQSHGAPEFKYMHYKKRWDEQIKRGGSRFEQWKFIDDVTYKKFVEARKDLKCVSGSNLRLWALQAAQTFRDPTFRFSGSKSWITNFKEKHGISSRRITKLVSKKESASMEAIMEAAATFQVEIKKVAKNYPPGLVLNTDQVGFVYEMIGNRTLSHTGEKLTLAKANSPTNLATHSYTCQYVISMAGDIIGDVFLCMQEQTGRFGDQVKKGLFPASNVAVTCSTSGKLTTSLYEYFLDNVILKSVKEDFLYVVDSWSGQTNAASYCDRFESETSPKCCLKIIPKKCTGLCQPLDTTFHRQLKYFARAIYAETKMNYNEDVNPKDELSTRNNIIRLHSLLHNQLSAPIFKTMIQYCWFSAGLSDEKPSFKSVRQACFEFEHGEEVNCSLSMCQNSRFLKCSHCRQNICFQCFFYDYHFHYE